MNHGVTQRIEGWPYGECVRASYATIFGCDIEAIPRLDPAAAADAGMEQEDFERKWLLSIGLGLVEISCDPEDSIPQEVLDCVPDVVHLMSGISPRGFGHRVVGVGGRVAFDPHPSRDGLLTVYSVGMLVPL
jgi:hypothetical protein